MMWIPVAIGETHLTGRGFRFLYESVNCDFMLCLSVSVVKPWIRPELSKCVVFFLLDLNFDWSRIVMTD